MVERDRPLVIRGARVLGAGGPVAAELLVEGGVLSGLDESVVAPKGALVLDARGCLVGPGLVDLHAHLREPGAEESETVSSGARAAALGGFTAVVAMPNTDPPIDCAAVAAEVISLGRGQPCEVLVAGAITEGRAGERLAPLRELAALGITLFTDDGSGVQDGALMRRALLYARDLPVTLAQHLEDASLAGHGVMHEGEHSSSLGLEGIPSSAEEVMLARDLALVRETGSPMHFLHLSSAGSVELLRRAKADGLEVSAEVTPHHLNLTDAQLCEFDPLFKVSPPLRSPGDRDALRTWLTEGVIDCIATDHAPHPPEAKDLPLDRAAPGMIGLETALSLSVSAMAAEMAPWAVMARLSMAPAAIARISPAYRALAVAHGGPLVVGSAANLCVFDPTATWIPAMTSASRSANTPFGSKKLTGRVRHTVLRGVAVVIDGELQC
ncbi:MAG: dihydroorotase [Acidimicrobiales bacterium]